MTSLPRRRVGWEPRRLFAAALGVTFAAGCAHHAVAAHPPPAVAPAEPSQFAEQDAQRAVAAGGSAPRIVAAGAGAPGDNLGGRIDADRAVCVLVLARGGPTIDDLDLFVYADDGTALGSDEAPGAKASVLVCPPHPAHLYAFARVASGHGIFAVTAQTVPAAAAEAVARATGAQGRLREGPLGAESQWPGLADALAAHRRLLGGTWREVRRVAVPLEPRHPTRLSGVVEKGQCLDFFTVPSDDVAYTELVVSTPEGRLLAQTPAERRKPALVVCSAERAEFTFALRPHGGRGLGAVILSVSDDSSTSNYARTPSDGVFVYEAQASRTVPEALAALSASVSRLGYGKARAAGGGMASVAHRESLDLDLPGGCTRVDVVGGAPLRGLDSWLWSSEQTLLAHDEGPASTTSFACGPGGGARLDVEGVTRAGPFAVETRHLDSNLPLLTQRPLAASRLLGRLLATSSPGAPLDLNGIVGVALSQTTEVTREATVPVGACLNVAVGLGPGAEGIELRVVDADSRDEIAFVRGTDGAVTSACAPTKPLRLRIELHVAAGSADAVVALRVRPPAPRRP